jgi:hypothetical protein
MDIIKDSTPIRNNLKLRIEELSLTPKQMIEEAERHGIIFTQASLSKYLNKGNVKGCLTQETIIWLCVRYGIDVKLLVNTPVADFTKPDAPTITMKLLPYNEQQCLTNLKKIFPNGINK